MWACVFKLFNCSYDFRLYEVIETLSGIHLILEYAHGGELFARLTSEKGPYKESEAKIIFAQIASAIQYMVRKSLLVNSIDLQIPL